jgi:hypothetical protein
MLRNYLIMLLVFSAILVGVSGIMTEMSANYGVDTGNITYLTSVEKVKDEAEDISENLENSQLTGTIADIPFMIISGGYSILKLIAFSLPDIWASFINDIAVAIGIPTEETGLRSIINIIVLIVTIVIIFEVLSVIFKWRS